MRLVRPEALGLLLLAAPLVWAWLRRPPTPTRVVSSLLLLRALPGASRQRRRLVDLLGLLLLLGALVGGTLGLAVETGPAPLPWIAVVDEGVGMQATTEDGRTRSERAVAALAAELAARPGAPVTLVGTAPPRVLAWQEAAPDRVLAALPDAPPGTHAAPGALLAGLCADGPPLRWFGDDPAPVAGCAAERVDLGEVDNTGLVEVTVRQVDRLGTVQVQAEVAGGGPAVAAVGGARVPLEGGRALLSLPAGGALRVVGAAADGLAADDAADLVLPPISPLRVGLVTDRPDGFVATALGTHPGLRLTTLSPDDAPAEDLDLLFVEAPPASGWPVAPRVVLLGVDAPALGMPAGRPVRPAALAPARPDDPLLAHMHLEGLRLPRARARAVPAGGRAVLEGGGAPLLVEGPFEGGRLVALGFDPAASDLPLRVDFVHLVANLVDWADPAPGVSAVAALPGAAETAPEASAAVEVAAAAAPRLTWWAGALLALLLVLGESLRAFRPAGGAR
jgi:hypothetical protein